MMSVILEANSSLMTMTSWALLTALVGVSALLIALFGMSALLIALFGMSAPLLVLSGMLAAPIFAVTRMLAPLFSLSGKTAPLFTLSRMMAAPFFLQPVMSMGPLIALVGFPILFLTVMNTRFFWNPYFNGRHNSLCRQLCLMLDFLGLLYQFTHHISMCAWRVYFHAFGCLWPL